MMPTRHVVHDYNPDHPKLDLRSVHVLGGLPFGGEVIDFIAGHDTPQIGQQLASIRAYARLAQSDGFEGEANVPHVEAGHTIAVDGHPRVTSERMLVAWVEHRLTQSTAAHVFPTDDLVYSNRFRLLETDRPFRPALRTPTPRVAGVVHATTDAPPAGATDQIAQLDQQGGTRCTFSSTRRTSPSVHDRRRGCA
jgi:type VI secretion system secreted protein VgrG